MDGSFRATHNHGCDWSSQSYTKWTWVSNLELQTMDVVGTVRGKSCTKQNMLRPFRTAHSYKLKMGCEITPSYNWYSTLVIWKTSIPLTNWNWVPHLYHLHKCFHASILQPIIRHTMTWEHIFGITFSSFLYFHLNCHLVSLMFCQFSNQQCESASQSHK